MRDEMDLDSMPGALMLADRLREYWFRRGFDVKPRIEYVAGNRNSNGGIYVIRSNLVRGLPEQS